MNHAIGDAIRRYRLLAGLSQEKLAAKAGGRNVTQINAYERGRSKPTPRVLSEIANALGVTLEQLSGQANSDPAPSQLAVPQLAAKIDECKKAFVQLTGLSEARVNVSITVS